MMSGPNLFSVALATRNGAMYLQEFLDSLLAQTQPPRELIASDDASSDDTLAILESFAARAPFPVTILSNLVALGVENNFAQAIAACGGLAIALADQDDVWRPDKLARLSQSLSAPDTLAAFSDAEVVDARLQPLGYTMWQRVHFPAGEQVRFTQGDGFGILLKHAVVTGATLAFKAQIARAALPIPPGWAHDAWLALVATALGNVAALAEPLIAYRQHGANVVGGRRKSFYAEATAALKLDRAAWYVQELSHWHGLQDRLNTLDISEQARQQLRDKLSHLETRAHLPAARWRRLPIVLDEIAGGGYTRFARNWGSVAIDLLLR